MIAKGLLSSHSACHAVAESRELEPTADSGAGNPAALGPAVCHAFMLLTLLSSAVDCVCVIANGLRVSDFACHAVTESHEPEPAADSGANGTAALVSAKDGQAAEG